MSDTWVYLVGSLHARPVRIGTTTDVQARLGDLQAGSPVSLHVIWQTRGGRALEGALHDRFDGYRSHSDWYDFADEHPVALIATAAVDLGYRAVPSSPAEPPPTQSERQPSASLAPLPERPEAARARRLASQIREAFALAGDPQHLTVADIVNYLRTQDPQTWGQWDTRRDRLAMAGRAIANTFRAAQLDMSTVRLNAPGRPTAYLLDYVVRAAR